LEWLADALRAHPELALFLTLALGYALGGLRIAGIQLGSVIGVLLVGVAVGQLGIPVSEDLKSTFFLLFLFSIGYKTGPQFFRGLRGSGLSQAALTAVLCVTGLASAVLVARVFGFDAGTAGGLIAGALTESATVGTAGAAIAKLGLDDAAKQALTTHVTVAFAVSYLVGLVTTILVLSRLAPRLLRVDLAAECRKLEEEMGVVHEEAGVVSAYFEFIMRAYEVPAALDGRQVSDVEALFPGERVFVERIRSGRYVFEPKAQRYLRAGDRVVLSGRRQVLVGEGNPLRAHEAEDPELLDIPTVTLDVVLTSRELGGRALQQIAREVAARGVFLRKLTRAGEELPVTPATRIERGDVLTLSGARSHVDAVAQQIGYAEWPTDRTDMVTVGLAIVIGGLIGIPALHLGRVELGLSKAVGALLGGLVAGWLRTRNPRFGRIPEPALWIFDSLGLNVFIGLVGLSAGPQFVQGLRESGIPLVAGAIFVTTTSILTAVFVGRFLFRVHPGVLLGICAGAATSAPALAALQEVAKSKIPTLGYGVSYAVGNVLLALWGSVIVAWVA
jgi:putative transport protein